MHNLFQVGLRKEWCWMTTSNLQMTCEIVESDGNQEPETAGQDSQVNACMHSVHLACQGALAKRFAGSPADSVQCGVENLNNPITSASSGKPGWLVHSAVKITSACRGSVPDFFGQGIQGVATAWMVSKVSSEGVIWQLQAWVRLGTLVMLGPWVNGVCAAFWNELWMIP